MIADNLNGCATSCKDNGLEKRVEHLEKANADNQLQFNSQKITTPDLNAKTAKIATVVAGGVKAEHIDGGAATLKSLVVDGDIKAKNFNITEPVIVEGITTKTANIGTADVTDLHSVNGNIKNLTVENLMTSPDSSLEYKNLTVTNAATINKLNLVDPHVTTIDSDTITTTDFSAQGINLSGDGKIQRSDNKQNILKNIDGATVLGDLNNAINIASKERPKWNDNSLATIADIQQGAVKPVYKGTVETFDMLPVAGNSKGDLYVVTNLTISDKTGIGHAQWNGASWDPSLIYELNYYYTKVESDNIADKELEDAIIRETDIIEGRTPVQKASAGLVNTEGELFATTDDAFMLYGAEGMDNIAENTSLDTLKTCSQYSADDALAATITDGPEGETGAFDLTVGYFNTDKTQPYQVYVNKASQRVYYRMTVEGDYDMVWRQLADGGDITAVKEELKAADIAETQAREAADTAIRTELGNGTLVAKKAGNAATLENKTVQQIIDSHEVYPVGSVITIETVTLAEARAKLPKYGTWYSR